MQTFKDVETGQYWQFEDDVTATKVGEYWVFVTVHGEAVDVPSTLVRVDGLPLPEVLPPAVPAVVSRFQGREAMHRTPHGEGSLFDAAEVALSHPDTPAMYRRAWDDLQEFHRDSEMLNAIAAALGLDSDDLDALFILAGSIKA